MSAQSLQDKFAPLSICFGCGPANKNGLQIKSMVEGEELIAHWTPQAHHAAFVGVLNGGIIGTLLDCHLNWTAAFFLMNKNNTTELPCTVTAEYSVKLRKPTPSSTELELRAHVVESSHDKVTVEGTLSSAGVITASCKGVFVAVKSEHPAFHRW